MRFTTLSIEWLALVADLALATRPAERRQLVAVGVVGAWIAGQAVLTQLVCAAVLAQARPELC